MSSHLVPAIVAWALCFGELASAQTVTRGPYLQLATPTSMVVRWRTDVAANSRVRYGNAPGNLINQVVDARATTDHEIRLTGLSAQSRYYYDIGTTAQILAGNDAEHAFDTAPTPGTEGPVRVWVIGDSGTANGTARAVRDAYLAFGGDDAPDVWLMLGDNAYTDGTDSQYQAAVFHMYPSILMRTAAWPTLGNHDGRSADSDTQTGPYYDIFTLPTLGEAGGVASGTEAYYSFDYANIHFICLDSYDSDRSPGGEMLTWLERDLEANRQKWSIAYWHSPPYTRGSHDSDVEARLAQMRENVVPVLESHRVDLVLSGHSHSYERSYQLHGHYGTSDTLTGAMLVDAGDGRSDGDGPYVKDGVGTVYMVAGSSGGTAGGPLNHPAMFRSLDQSGSVVLDVDGDRLNAAFIDQDGSVGDYFTILKAQPIEPRRGLYFDRRRAGHGFDLQRSGDRYFLLLSSYQPDQRPVWYLAVGSLENGVFSGIASQYDYDAERTPPQAVIAGTGGLVSLDFVNAAQSAACNDGYDRREAVSLALFEFDLESRRDTWCVEPFVFDDGDPKVDFSGSWGNENDAGWGLSIHTQGNSLLSILYYYDALGQPRWALGSVADVRASQPIEVGMFEVSGFCSVCEPADLDLSPNGRIILTLTEPSQDLTAGNIADIDVSFLGAPGGAWTRRNTAIRQLSDPMP